ncbi:MAG TPA: hypothetical protein VLE46_06440, partial [Nitrospira sp.]|nr:hypothetical protein [Nitrospira sp.]
MHRLAAQAQMTRISQAIAGSKSTIPEPRAGATQQEMRNYIRDGTRRMQQVMAEIHLYFVSWAGCRNMLRILVGQPEFLEAKKVFDSYRSEFEHYVAGRNSFEHFHDRLPGQADAHRVKEIQPDPQAGPHRVFAGFSSNGKYVHSDLEWDISPGSLERLEKYISEILFVVHAKIDEKFIRKGVPG